MGHHRHPRLHPRSRGLAIAIAGAVVADGLTVDPGAADRLGASLTRAADALEDPSGLTDRIARQVASDAGARTPRRTGALAGSLTVRGATIEANPATVLTWGARYGVFVNFGTRYMRAQPFATDALATATSTADTELATWAGTIIDRIGT